MTLEKIILKNLVKNDDYIRKVLPFIQEEYFGNSHERIFFSHVKTYFEQYNSLPSKEALAIIVSNDKQINERDFESIKETLKEIADDNEETNTNFLINETEKFCKDRAIYNAIIKSVNIIEGKDEKLDKGALPKLLSDALGVSFDNHVGHDYIENSDERFDFYHKKENKIPFALDYFNRITSGGISEKTLTVVLAGTGVGKSLFMCDMAASNFMMGKNVLYITLEMAEERIAERIDANLLNVPIVEMRKLSEDSFNKKLAAVKSKTSAKLVVKEYPTASANVNHFRVLLNELVMKKNFVPDIIFIDYLNICTSSRLKVGSNANSYTYVKSIAEEIRGLAVEYSIPIVTATQTTRSGYCLDPNTLVICRTGNKKLDEVIIGDELLSNNGWNKVKTIFPKTSKKMYKITTESGKTIVCSEDHLFPTESGEKNIKSGLCLEDKLFINNNEV